MKTPKNTIWKLIVLLCLANLPACQFRGRRDQGLSNSPSPAVPSTATVAPPSEEASTEPLTFVTGRNDYVVDVDDTNRRFIVYVPGSYDASRPTPVVIIYHASNHNGASMYDSTGWAAKAEQENFIAVFPTSWKYLLTSSNKIEAKWYDIAMEVTEPTVEFKDDVHFTKSLSLNFTFAPADNSANEIKQ